MNMPDCNGTMACLIATAMFVMVALVAVTHYGCELQKLKPEINARRAEFSAQNLHRTMMFGDKPERQHGNE